MSITTYKLEVLFGGWTEPSEAEEFFIRLRDAVQSCGYWVQNVQLDCHFEGCRISQMPDGGMFGRNDIRVQPLDEALEGDKMMDEVFKRTSIREENAKSE